MNQPRVKAEIGNYTLLSQAELRRDQLRELLEYGIEIGDYDEMEIRVEKNGGTWDVIVEADEVPGWDDQEKALLRYLVTCTVDAIAVAGE